MEMTSQGQRVRNDVQCWRLKRNACPPGRPELFPQQVGFVLAEHATRLRTRGRAWRGDLSVIAAVCALFISPVTRGRYSAPLFPWRCSAARFSEQEPPSKRVTCMRGICSLGVVTPALVNKARRNHCSSERWIFLCSSANANVSSAIKGAHPPEALQAPYLRFRSFQQTVRYHVSCV